MNYLQKIWIKILSSPLLELYTKTILMILQTFDIVFKDDSPFWQCQKINLALRRHLYWHHDYAVLVKKIKYYHAVLIHPTLMFMKIFINYVFALQVIYIFILKPLLHPILNVFHELKLLIHETQLQIILCFEDLSFSENKNTRATGGGPSYELNYNDLCLYSNQVKANMKYLFHSYIPESEKSHILLESNDLIAIPSIPLNIILSKLTVENLKLISKAHNIKTHSKMKSQEIQLAINSHICNNCVPYIWLFKCVDNHILLDKHKADLLKANKKYQTKNSETYKVAHLKSVQKNQAKNSEIYKATHLESVKKIKSIILKYIKLHI